MYSWNDLFPPSVAPSQPKQSPVAVELERLSSAIPTFVNARDFEFKSLEAAELLSHVAPEFVAHMDPMPGGRSWSEQVSAWRERAQEHPEVHFAIEQVSSAVNEKKGAAQVYMDMEVSGIGDVKLHAVNELKWRRVQEIWLLFSVTGMRGTPGNSGMG